MTDDKPWLSLPDEEPPERGFAELMAAARAKAEVMARPPWWKRALDLMKRPPVLALATVVVLLGGVIVVGHHGDEVQPEPPAPVVAPPIEATPVTPQVVQTPHATETPPAPPPPPPPPAAKPTHHRTAPTKTSPLKTQKLEIAGPTADDEAEVVQKAPVARPEPLSTQLRRCRAAATNNDCAGARTCAKQLEQRDRSYYDANVANDATLKPCL